MSNEKSLAFQLKELEDRCSKLQKDVDGKEDETSLLRGNEIRNIRMNLEGYGGVIVYLSIKKVKKMVEGQRKAIEHLEKNPQNAGAHKSFRVNDIFKDQE